MILSTPLAPSNRPQQTPEKDALECGFAVNTVMIRIAKEGVRYLRQPPVARAIGVEMGTEHARSRHSPVTCLEHGLRLGGVPGFEARILVRENLSPRFHPHSGVVVAISSWSEKIVAT